MWDGQAGEGLSAAEPLIPWPWGLAALAPGDGVSV